MCMYVCVYIYIYIYIYDNKQTNRTDPQRVTALDVSAYVFSKLHYYNFQYVLAYLLLGPGHVSGS